MPPSTTPSDDGGVGLGEQSDLGGALAADAAGDDDVLEVLDGPALRTPLAAR